MSGKIFITRSGYDPQLGKHVKDPYLGEMPSMGACRPDLRKVLKPGDHIFVVSGKVRGVQQFVMGGFEVATKMKATDAFYAFPQQRLRLRSDGQLTGNIIVDEDGKQSSLDDHSGFGRRLENYIVGKDLIALVSDEEIRRGRDETLEALREILKRQGARPIDLIGRSGQSLSEKQVDQLATWLRSLKAA